jgi:hypothetical protein
VPANTVMPQLSGPEALEEMRRVAPDVGAVLTRATRRTRELSLTHCALRASFSRQSRCRPRVWAQRYASYSPHRPLPQRLRDPSRP